MDSMSKSNAGAPANYGAHPAYDPAAWTAPPQDRAEEGTLVLVDENGNQVGALGEHISVTGVVPGSHGSLSSTSLKPRHPLIFSLL